ncbi:MAG: helix-turn-helix transcriptional regulator [Pseudomonadota bacterium]
MTAGVIIRERLLDRAKARKMSQAELARRAKVSQPAINSLFTGVARTSRHLRAIARELNTTPEYLEGLTDDPSADFAMGTFSDEEIEWVHLLRSNTPANRNHLLSIARGLAAADAD